MSKHFPLSGTVHFIFGRHTDSYVLETPLTDLNSLKFHNKSADSVDLHRAGCSCVPPCVIASLTGGERKIKPESGSFLSS